MHWFRTLWFHWMGPSESPQSHAHGAYNAMQQQAIHFSSPRMHNFFYSLPYFIIFELTN